MKQTTEVLSEKQKKQRSFLLVLPIIILPFLTFLFWSLGLVGGAEVKASSTSEGFNMASSGCKAERQKKLEQTFHL